MSEVAIRDDADRREPTAEDGIEPGSEPESEPGSEPGVDLGAPGVAAMLALAAGAIEDPSAVRSLTAVARTLARRE